MPRQTNIKILNIKNLNIKNLKLGSLAAILLLAIANCNSNLLGDNAKQNAEQKTKNAVSRLDTVKSRGKLVCGVNGQLPGFSFVDEQGAYSGLDVDLCRAVAAALFYDPNKVEFRNLNVQERFTAVQSGKVDLLSRNTTWTLSRDTSVGMEFAPTTFYDGQGLLVSNASNIEKLADLNGKSVCVLSGTTNEQNLAAQMRKLGLNYFPLLFEDVDLLYTAYEADQCETATSDRSQLVVKRTLLEKPGDHKVLNIVLSKEPLGPLTAEGDSSWFDTIKWVTYAMIQAEKLGINSQNVASFNRSTDPQTKRFLGLSGNLGKNMGLPNDFARRVIKHVGNYEEVYQRNIGEPYKLERGLNALWQDGGLMYSPPFR